MKEILACLIVSIVSWIYFFYERKKAAKKKADWIMKFWYMSLDIQVLMCAVAFTIFAVYLIIESFISICDTL